MADDSFPTTNAFEDALSIAPYFLPLVPDDLPFIPRVLVYEKEEKNILVVLSPAYDA